MSSVQKFAQTIRTDPIELEIFGKIFASTVEQMGVTIARTAHTTFVREVQDFGNALATTDGHFFAYPRTLGASTLLGLPFADCISAFDEYHDGDVMFTNDPFLSKAGCTHVPDLTVWAPVMIDGELLCFTWGFIHSSDIGGSVPGSIAPSLVDTFQEGIRIPPIRLYSKGKVNEDVRAILRNNVRIPDQMWGDVQALRAGMQLAERKLKDLARRHGVAKMHQVMDDLLLYSELKARRIFEKIPNGTYRFTDFVEDDTISNVPIRICLAMTATDGHIHLDYTGTDPQVAAAYNVPTAGKVHPWVMSALGYFVVSQDPDIPTNSGFFRAITVDLPEGSIVNPIFPAAIGLRSLAGVRMIELILAALTQALPELTPAAGSGVSTVVMLSVPDFDRPGGRRINVVNPCVGGSGGRPMADGFDGVDFLFGFMRNTPAEILESETAILFKRFGFRCDSGGAGKFRGGLAVSLEFQVTAPDATVIARGMDRTLFDPWGTHGGQPGSRMPLAVINRGGNSERSIRKIDVLRLDAGDILHIQSPGGGGWGNPLERDPEKVRQDLDFGFISADAADGIYGVKFDAIGAVDVATTKAQRAQLEAAREKSSSVFALGAHRAAMDQLWPPEACRALAQILDQVPILMRYRIKNKMYETLVPAGRSTPITSGEIDECWNTVRQQLYPAQLVTRRNHDSVSSKAKPA